MTNEIFQYFYICGLGSIIFLSFALWKKHGYFCPIVWFTIHMGLYYFVAPFVEVKYSQYRFHPLTLFTVLCTISFTLLWFLIFVRAKTFGKIARFTHNLARRIENRETTVRKRVILVSACGYCVFLCSIYLLYGSTLETVFANPIGYRRFMSRGVISLLYSLQVKLLYDVFFIYLAFRAYRKLRLVTVPILSYTLFLFALSFSFGSRGIIAGVLFQLVILHEVFVKRISFLRLSVLSLFALAVFVFYLEYRTQAAQTSRAITATLVDSLSASRDLGWAFRLVIQRLDAMFNLDTYFRALDAEDIGVEPLVSFANAWQQFVPRNFAQDKPLYFSSEMTRVLLPDVFRSSTTYDFTGMAEFVHNFSWEGIMFFSLIPALLLAFLQRAYLTGDRFIVYFLIYLPFVGLPTSIINNGFLNTGNVILFLPITAIYLWFYFFLFSRHRKIVIGP